MSYVIRYTRATNHIEGIAERSTGTGADTGSGVIGYYATSACPSLSRSATRMGVVAAHDSLAIALEDARDSCEATGRSLCKHCEKAALRALEDTTPAPEAPAAHGCPERTTVDGIGYPCVREGEHDVHTTALGHPWTTAPADAERAYDLARREYRYAFDRADSTGDAADRIAADDAWGSYLAAADRAGKCRSLTCYGDAEPGETWCVFHCMKEATVAESDPVVAVLDHTEPGKAIAIITGSHGRTVHPQAWLSHGAGAWVLTDDYNDASYSVTGPDASAAVRAWAVLIGLDLADLTVTVQYAGGPVSPAVREVPEARGAALAWVRDREEVNVFHARGNAHTYRVTEHGDGASLVAYLRGKGGPVEAYRRRYTTRPGARRAAQAFEHRYGPMYAPAA